MKLIIRNPLNGIPLRSIYWRITDYYEYHNVTEAFASVDAFEALILDVLESLGITDYIEMEDTDV